jgi:DNA replicative helicase MCM subunit Mcm2 (Cdc46/Mcm family)
MNEKYTSAVSDETGAALLKILNRINKLSELPDLVVSTNALMEMDRLNERLNEKVDQENDIKSLKKWIKYAKTPMERKMYEQQLNATYKKRKQKQ